MRKVRFLMSNLLDHQPSILVKMLFEMSFFQGSDHSPFRVVAQLDSSRPCLEFAQVTISCSMLVKMESHNANRMVLSRWSLTLLIKENEKEGETGFITKY